MDTEHDRNTGVARQGDSRRRDGSGSNRHQPRVPASRHRLSHNVRLSYAANWRIKHLAKAWGVSYSEAVDRLVLEAYGMYEDGLTDVGQCLG
jgi:hypothetical protein